MRICGAFNELANDFGGLVVLKLSVTVYTSMTVRPKNVDKPTPNRTPVVFMLTTIADTTWRMFIPTIGLTFLGWLGDKQWATKPWLLAVGVLVGASISALLVRQQLKQPSTTKETTSL